MADFVQSKVHGDSDVALIAGDLNINARASRNDGKNSSSEYIHLMDRMTTMVTGIVCLFRN